MWERKTKSRHQRWWGYVCGFVEGGFGLKVVLLDQSTILSGVAGWDLMIMHSSGVLGVISKVVKIIQVAH